MQEVRGSAGDVPTDERILRAASPSLHVLWLTDGVPAAVVLPHDDPEPTSAPGPAASSRDARQRTVLGGSAKHVGG